MRIVRYMQAIAMLVIVAVVGEASEFTNTYTSLTMSDGVVYSNARPQRVSGKMLVLFHSKGISTVKITALPFDVQNQLGLVVIPANYSSDELPPHGQTATEPTEQMLKDFKQPGLVTESIWIEPGFTTRSGKRYSNVRVDIIEPDAIHIDADQNNHSVQFIRVPMDDLPPELQKQFNYDPVKAREYALIKPRAMAYQELNKEALKQEQQERKRKERELASATREKEVAAAKASSSLGSAQADMADIAVRYEKSQGGVFLLLSDLTRFTNIHPKYAYLSYSSFMAVLNGTKAPSVYGHAFSLLTSAMINAEFTPEQSDAFLAYTISCYIHHSGPNGVGPGGEYMVFLKKHKEKSFALVRSISEKLGRGSGAFNDGTSERTYEEKQGRANELLEFLQ